MSSRRIYIGTSGWDYPSWQDSLYTPDLPRAQWLTEYARHFPCVEVEQSFFGLPERSLIRQWVDITPDDFIFAVRAGQAITYDKKLRHCESALEKLLSYLTGFGTKLGPILFQLPPQWTVNTQRLQQFLQQLPTEGRYQYAFEFRDTSWHTEAVYELLADFNACFVVYDRAGFQTTPVVTSSDTVCARLHGPDAAHTESYPVRSLQAWARQVLNWQSNGQTVYLFFNNHSHGWAFKNARLLQHYCDDLLQT